MTTTLRPARDSLGPAEVRPLAAELDLRPTKQRGQNFVIDANTVRRIVRESGVGRRRRGRRGRPRARVADPRAARGRRRVVAIEVDPVLAERAARHVRGVRPGRRRTAARWCSPTRCAIDAVPGPPPTALVANLPYNVSVPGAAPPAEPAAVARARAGDGAGRGGRPAGRRARAPRSTASRASRPPGTPTYAGPARSAATSSGRPPTSTPASSPGPGASPPATTATREQVFAVVDAAFAQRRKVLRGALRGLAGSAEAASAALRGAGVDPMARGESLDGRGLRPDRRGPAATRRAPTGHEHHGPRGREDQPPPRGRRAPRATASTRWTPSTRRSALYDDVTVTAADE